MVFEELAFPINASEHQLKEIGIILGIVRVCEYVSHLEDGIFQLLIGHELRFIPAVMSPILSYSVE